MRRSMTDAILKAYDDIAHNIPEDAPDSTAAPLLVQFTLGDLRAYKRNIERLRESAKLATGG